MPKCELSGLEVSESKAYLCGLTIYIHPMYDRLATKWLAKNENNKDLEKLDAKLHAAIHVGDEEKVVAYIEEFQSLTMVVFKELQDYLYEKAMELKSKQ